MHTTNLAVELEIIASTIRRQERRFEALIEEILRATIDGAKTEQRLRSIEYELRCLPVIPS